MIKLEIKDSIEEKMVAKIQKKLGWDRVHNEFYIYIGQTLIDQIAQQIYD